MISQQERADLELKIAIVVAACNSTHLSPSKTAEAILTRIDQFGYVITKPDPLPEVMYQDIVF